MTQPPTRADLYVRLSDLRPDDNHVSSLADQEQRLREHAAALGWNVRRVVVENDVNGDGRAKPASAYKRRKVRVPGSTEPQLRVIRPGFRSIVDDMTRGRCDGLLALDLDRAVRDPRDLEDLIDAVEQHGAVVESVTGSLRLATDADITMARVMVAMANKSSRDTGRRVSAARQRRARDGKFGGGKRPYGFAPDGVTVLDHEAEVIRETAHAVLSGQSLEGLVRDLNSRGVPSATGRKWATPTLRDILMRDRNAGLTRWKDETYPTVLWEPIVTPAVHKQVVALLESRSTGPGRPPRWLGSGVYRCGKCADGGRVYVTVGGSFARYVCRGDRHRDPRSLHLTRRADRTDELVEAVAVEYLAVHDEELLTVQAGADVDVAALSAERRALRARLTQIGGDVALGLLTREAGIDATRRGRQRITEIDQLLAAAEQGDPLSRWVADPQAVWDAATLEERRWLVRRLLTVTLLPAAGTNRWRPESVRIEPRRGTTPL